MFWKFHPVICYQISVVREDEGWSVCVCGVCCVLCGVCVWCVCGVCVVLRGEKKKAYWGLVRKPG